MSDHLKIAIQYLLPKKLVSTAAGRLATCQYPPLKNFLIREFIKKFNVNMSEALEPDYRSYPDFNHFFIRPINPSCRPIDPNAIISPVDGCISEIGSIEHGKIIQAKGKDYTVEELLAASPEYTQAFSKGCFTTIYLSPKDYHRVHMPISGQLQEMIYVPGKLFSVQPATTRHIPRLFSRNERLVMFFDTPVGLMAIVMVGAVIVGAMGTSWHGDLVRCNQQTHFTYPQAPGTEIKLAKGDELGYFKLGSTVILMFADQAKAQWLAHLQPQDAVRLGQALTTVTTENTPSE